MTKIIQRHDTAANWSIINPILALGEMGVETDTNKFKFGDGTTRYNELPYAAGEGGGSGSGTTITSKDGTTSYNKLALGDTLYVADTTIKELNGVTQTGGTLNSELEFTGGSGAYLKMNEKYDLATANSWEFQIKYKHNGGGSYPTIFGYAGSSDYKNPTFVLVDGILTLFLSSDGSLWDLNGTNSSLAPIVGTIYYFKVGFTGSQYYIKYNTTGWSDEFTTQWTLSSTTKVYCSDYFMLMNLGLNDNYYNTGTMYLQDTALIINEAEVWRGVNITPGPITLDVNPEKIDKQDKLTAGDGIDISLRYTDATLPLVTLPYTFTSKNTTVFTSNQMLDDGAAICFKVSQESIGSFIAIKESGGNGVAFQVRDNAIYSHYRVGDSDGVIASSSEMSITQGIYYKVKYHNGSNLELFYSLDGINYIAIGTWTGYGSNFYNHDIYMVAEPRYGGGDCTVTKLELIGSTTSSILTISSTVSIQDIKKFTGYSDTGTLVLKSINGVLQWVAEA